MDKTTKTPEEKNKQTNTHKKENPILLLACLLKESSMI
jgi:hypothetical protein